MAADRAEDQAGNPSPVASHEAHGAGLAAGVHHSILGVSQGHDFRVGSRVSQFDYAASAFRSDFIRDDHDCAASGRPRTEELRALTWDQVNLEGNPAANPPVSAVHHGVAFRPGAGKECAALVPQHRREDKPQRRRLDTARNGHSFVSLLSDSVVPIDRIARASRPRWRLDGHGDGLPQAGPPCAPGRRGSDGPHLRRPHRRIDAQLDAHRSTEAPTRSGRGPLTWSRLSESNR